MQYPLPFKNRVYIIKSFVGQCVQQIHGINTMASGSGNSRLDHTGEPSLISMHYNEINTHKKALSDLFGQIFMFKAH